MRNVDLFSERLARAFASYTSRRSIFAFIGGVVLGGVALPLLPVMRAGKSKLKDLLEGSQDAESERPTQSTGNPQDPGDPAQCDYWRYCAIDGFLCSCCGGSVSSCPPGTEMSPLTWIGTCRNSADERRYIISYNDCCGGAICGRCDCHRNEGNRPIVRPQNNNEITWCFGTTSQAYTCSTARILGVAIDEG